MFHGSRLSRDGCPHRKLTRVHFERTHNCTVPNRPHRPESPGHRSRREREVVRLREECARLITEIERVVSESGRIAEKLRELAR